METLSLTGKRWQQAPLRWLEQIQVQDLLQLRGIEDPSASAQFLQPSLQHLPNPMLLQDMEPALMRMMDAIKRQETIWILGDYDVDGTCATAALSQFLQAVGGQVRTQIPHRQHDGYGLQTSTMAQLRGKTQLLLTVDCGSTSHEAIAWGNEHHIDTIVLDHHQMSASRPPALACINPQQESCAFPDKQMCATAVVFLTLIALRSALRQQGFFQQGPEPDVREVLDLVALATVADMMPLVGINRLLVHAGLVRMRAGKVRRGLLALAEVSKCQMSQLSASDIGFRLAPRINAHGRMDSAQAALALLTAQEMGQAMVAAQQLEQANQQRKLAEEQVFQAAQAQIEQQQLQQHAAIVVADEQWHPGVVGLVAGKLAQMYQRPALVIGAGGKGSGRSLPGVNLHGCLQSCKDHLMRFGGHPAAVGLTLTGKIEDLLALRQGLHTHLQGLRGTPPYTAHLQPDVLLGHLLLEIHLVEQLEPLSPFGQGNKEPLFQLQQLQVSQPQVVGNTHLKLRLGPKQTAAIAFGMGHLCHQLPAYVDVLTYVERCTFYRQPRLQLRLADVRTSQLEVNEPTSWHPHPKASQPTALRPNALGY